MAGTQNLHVTALGATRLLGDHSCFICHNAWYIMFKSLINFSTRTIYSSFWNGIPIAWARWWVVMATLLPVNWQTLKISDSRNYLQCLTMLVATCCIHVAPHDADEHILYVLSCGALTDMWCAHIQDSTKDCFDDDVGINDTFSNIFDVIILSIPEHDLSQWRKTLHWPWLCSAIYNVVGDELLKGNMNLVVTTVVLHYWTVISIDRHN